MPVIFDNRLNLEIFLMYLIFGEKQVVPVQVIGKTAGRLNLD